MSQIHILMTSSRAQPQPVSFAERLSHPADIDNSLKMQAQVVVTEQPQQRSGAGAVAGGAAAGAGICCCLELCACCELADCCAEAVF